MSEVAETVKKIISAELGLPWDMMTENASFTGDLGADSLDHFELVLAFEEHFGIEITKETAEKIRTVKEAIDYITTEVG
jgi:acyl carrier protein